MSLGSTPGPENGGLKAQDSEPTGYAQVIY